VDYITPPVDDPYWFGQIAAANALSDIYAMGGRPLTALNMVMFPADKLPQEQLKEILRGGDAKVSEAGASLAGGHSVDNIEPMYGLAVMGVVHPDRILLNKGAREGDALVLTKPIGTGVLFNACRSGRLPLKELEPLLHTIASLNGRALEAAAPYEIHACTDITGFGLSGHLIEMIEPDNMEATLFFSKIPLYPYAVEMYRNGETTRSNKLNSQMAEGRLKIKTVISPEQRELLFDPQTSGGLLFALPKGQETELLHSLLQAGITDAAIIGEVRKADRALLKIV